MTNGAPHFKNTELSALRDYVTHDSGSLNKADSTLLLMVTHSNLQARFMEIRFDRYVRARPRGEASDRWVDPIVRLLLSSRAFQRLLLTLLGLSFDPTTPPNPNPNPNPNSN
jgi:hypothetical protein